MSEEDFDARAAGISIAEAYAYLQSTFENVSEFFNTLDLHFGKSDPPWTSRETAITWDMGTLLRNPDRWMPRFFIRAWWLEEERSEQLPPMRHLIIVYLALANAERGEDEPWIGCHLLKATAVADAKRDFWESRWVRDLEGQFDIQWIGRPGEIYDWSEPKGDVKVPYETCGFFHHLTDIRSADQVKRFIVDPLVKIYQGADPPGVVEDASATRTES